MKYLYAAKASGDVQMLFDMMLSTRCDKRFDCGLFSFFMCMPCKRKRFRFSFSHEGFVR